MSLNTDSLSPHPEEPGSGVSKDVSRGAGASFETQGPRLAPQDEGSKGAKALLPRIILAALALTLVAGALGLIAWLISLYAPPPPPPPRNPFGTALPREALPSTTGIGALLLSWQSAFYRELTATLKAIHASSSALPGLLSLAFGYGVFHAAGPGHGKAVISGYIVADNRSLRRGLALSFAAAMLQALVAIALVLTITIALRATAATMSATTTLIEQASFALVGLVGLWVLWRKAGAYVALAGGATHDTACGHVHLPGPEEIASLRSWREMAGVVFAAGLRPCAGALIILVFAFSQGLLWAGIAATFAMALGTALTTGTLAALAVFFKFAALRLAGGGSLRGAKAIAALELLAAAFVTVLGAALFLGLMAGGQG